MLHLAILDLCSGAVAVATGVTVRFGPERGAFDDPSHLAILILFPPLWLAAMASTGAYDRLFLTSSGTDHYRPVLRAGARILVVMAFLALGLHANVSRELLLTVIPSAVALTMVGRRAMRSRLARRCSVGAVAHRALAIGSPYQVRDLAAHMHRAPHHGVRIVGAITPGTAPASAEFEAGIPWFGAGIEDAAGVARRVDADVIAVAGSEAVRGGCLRRLAWELEETELELVVAPAVTDVAGPRIRVRPLEGLPLLHIERPRLSGGRRVARAVVDRALAAVLLVLLLPMMLGIAAAVRLSSPGPALFRQARVGLGGRRFTLLKFRTMTAEAPNLTDAVAHLNHCDQVLFKIRRDPRVTRLGRWLRRSSLDELPQLLNVVSGSMSLVGPRPPLPSEVARFGEGAHRRLLVKPGMTGLWQVSGRSELTWSDTVRLDLYYVENWSIALDCLILAKTVIAVLRGRGAY